MLVPVLALLLGAANRGGQAQQGSAFPILACETIEPGRVLLKMLVLNAGQDFAADGAARLAFVEPSAPERPLELPEPGPRTSTVPLDCSGWGPGHVEVVPFGPFVLDERTPARLQVRGGLVGEPPVALGTLIAGGGEGPEPAVRFLRARPESLPEDGCAVVVVGACEAIDGDRLVVRLGFFNCGERLDRDYWAFLHFEPEPTGENLAVTSEMGLHPVGRATDSSAWCADEVTVLTFGPYSLPANLEQPLYLCAGLYDREGGGRLALFGCDEDQRVRIGRLVPDGGRVVFVRDAAPWEGESP